MPSFATRSDVLSWGRVHRRPQRVAAPRFRDQLPALIAASAAGCLATGLRRSYGDSCLNSSGSIIDMTGLDRLMFFDPVTGVIRADAGASLAQILRLVVPHGWFLPTTPGTRFVTLGGAVANDVHGKNHHRAGSFGLHVRSMEILRSDGFRGVLTPDGEYAGLFAATIGGLGLTGVIEWVEIQLERIDSAYLDVETIPFAGLDGFWAIAEESGTRFEHSVAWVDCGYRGVRLRRGVFSRGNWRDDRDLRPHDDNACRNVPVDAPHFLLNRFSATVFNEVYYRMKQAKVRRSRQHYAQFFYPLDTILNWNRLYGARGMLQYQCVVPPAQARGAVAMLLDEIAKSGQPSILAVLKVFGPRPSRGILSFPRPGVTLALDFPNRGEQTLRLMCMLDRIVGEAGGAVYPAKDGRLPPEVFRLSFPRWQAFVDFKDPGMNSDLWRRVAE